MVSAAEPGRSDGSDARLSVSSGCFARAAPRQDVCNRLPIAVTDGNTSGRAWLSSGFQGKSRNSLRNQADAALCGRKHVRQMRRRGICTVCVRRTPLVCRIRMVIIKRRVTQSDGRANSPSEKKCGYPSAHVQIETALSRDHHGIVPACVVPHAACAWDAKRPGDSQAVGAQEFLKG